MKPESFSSHPPHPARKITRYEIRFHGLDHPQYFPGHGIALTDWSDCATGIGDSEQEALEDALEQLALSGWDVGTVEVPGNLSYLEEDNGDLLYHVSVNVKG